jgi:hypothetical protein
MVGRELLTLCPLGEDHRGRLMWGDITRGRRKMFIDSRNLIVKMKRTAFY